MAESQLRRCDSHPVPLPTMSANSSDKSNRLALTGDLKAKEGVPVKETTNESRTANTAVEQPRVAGLEDSGEKNADPRETDEPGGRARDNGLNATTPTTPTGRPLIGGAKILPTEMTRLKIEVIVKESEASSAIFRETLLNPPKIVQEVIKRVYYAYVRPKFPALDFNVTVNKCNFFGKRSETDLSCEDSVQLIGSYELTFTNVELAPNTTLNEYVVRMSPGGADEKTVKADSTNAMSNAEVEKAEVAKSPDKTANLSIEDTETRQNNSEKKTRVQCSSQADVTSEEISDCWDSEEERTERDGFIDVEVESIHQIPNSPPPTESSSLDSQEAEQCADSGIAEACAPAPQPGKRNFFICMTKCDVQGIVGRRIRRRALKMRCPNGGCPEEPRTWTCAMCSGTLYWDYEDALFCKCGILQNHLMRFKCAHVDHGQRYVLNHALLDEAIAGIEPCEDINVVLLGETGVGKSTWINSIFNYLPFASLDAALAADEMQIPIPVSFPVGKIGAAERVFFGIRDENERYEENQSATQRPKTYTFWFRDHLYRFIDVPGVNDTRGMQQDDKNFEMIMNELHHYEKIHAFCILMESGLCRLTISIRHCLGELFSHLHKDAAKNIVFCFTKSKTFNEGATERLLQRELEKLKERRDVQIALNEETMYAFNNEAFRFLCFQKHPSSTGALEHTREELLRNWDVSAESTRRLLLYIASIEPHNTRKFLSLNEAKRVIYQLTPVSAEITKNIQANKRIVRDKMHEINRFLDNLKNSGNLECNMVTTQVTISLRASRSSIRRRCARSASSAFLFSAPTKRRFSTSKCVTLAAASSAWSREDTPIPDC